MKKSVQAAIAVGMSMLAVGFVTAAPAAANDLTFKFYSPYTGNHLATATYDDLTDTYCIRYISGHTAAHLYTSWMDGTGQINLSDGADAGQTCTGNLSIAEDRQRKLYIVASEWPSDTKTHYT
jgi:hypothetical protein